MAGHGRRRVLDGEPSRSVVDKRWIPVRLEKMCELAYDQMEGNSVDRAAEPVNFDLYDVLES